MLRSLIQRHVKYTSSTVGRAILLDWDAASKNFVKVGTAGATTNQQPASGSQLAQAPGFAGARKLRATGNQPQAEATC